MYALRTTTTLNLDICLFPSENRLSLEVPRSSRDLGVQIREHLKFLLCRIFVFSSKQLLLPKWMFAEVSQVLYNLFVNLIRFFFLKSKPFSKFPNYRNFYETFIFSSLLSLYIFCLCPFMVTLLAFWPFGPESLHPFIHFELHNIKRER